jgi:hypothetical protein
MLQRERSRSTTLEIPSRHDAMHLKKSVATDYRALVENQTGAGDGPALCVQPKRRRHISRQRRYRIPTHMAICCYEKKENRGERRCVGTLRASGRSNRADREHACRSTISRPPRITLSSLVVCRVSRWP